MSMSAPLPPDESRATALEALLWTEFSVATVFIFLRLTTRYLRLSLGLDDVLMTGSWVRWSFNISIDSAIDVSKRFILT